MTRLIESKFNKLFDDYEGRITEEIKMSPVQPLSLLENPELNTIEELKQELPKIVAIKELFSNRNKKRSKLTK